MTPDIDAKKQAVINAARELLDANGAAAFCLPVPGTDPVVYVAAGTLEEMAMVLPE